MQPEAVRSVDAERTGLIAELLVCDVFALVLVVIPGDKDGGVCLAGEFFRRLRGNDIGRVNAARPMIADIALARELAENGELFYFIQRQDIVSVFQERDARAGSLERQFNMLPASNDSLSHTHHDKYGRWKSQPDLHPVIFLVDLAGLCYYSIIISCYIW